MPLIKKSDINKLIEMIKETSPMSAFLLQALVCNSYPSHLEWMEGDLGDLAFCLDCPTKRNTEWTQEVQNIFMDYTTFTTRSKAEDNGKRTVFLNGLIKSPYIEFDKRLLSTQHKKYYNFNKRFEELANSKLEDIFLHNAASMQTTEYSSVSIVTVLEDLMLQSTTIESIPTSIEPPNMTVTLYGFENEFQTILSERDLQEYFEQVDVVPMETESPVPNISIMETSQDPLSFYDEISNNSCNCSIDGNLTNAEPSTRFLVSEESSIEYPSNYDPSAEFVSSMENDLNLSMRVNSSSFDILGIHSFKYVGNQVPLLERVNLDSPVPFPSSDDFMLTVKPTSE